MGTLPGAWLGWPGAQRGASFRPVTPHARGRGPDHSVLSSLLCRYYSLKPQQTEQAQAERGGWGQAGDMGSPDPRTCPEASEASWRSGAPPATLAPTPGSSGLEGAGLVPRTGGQHRRDRPGFPSRLAEGGRRPEFGTRPKGPAAIRSFSSRLLRPHFRPGVGSWGCGAAPADRPLQSVPLQQCLPGCPGLPEERPPQRPAGPGLAPGSAVLVITCLSSCAGPDRRGHRTGRGEQGSASGWSGWGRGVELLRSPLVCSSHSRPHACVWFGFCSSVGASRCHFCLGRHPSRSGHAASGTEVAGPVWKHTARAPV